MATVPLALMIILAAGSGQAGPAEFSHQQHLGKGLECVACHDVTSRPDKPVLQLLKIESCSACHQRGVPEYKALPAQRPLDLAFPHRAHAEKLRCTECHQGIAEDKLPTAGAPVMDKQTCFACHQEKQVPVSMTACARCHGIDLKSTRPKTHGPDWRLTHGQQAAWSVADGEHGQDCRQCHSKSSCTECHDQMAPQNHTGLWRMQTHGIAAEWDRDRCKTCHETSTCVRCHQTTQPMNHTGAWINLHGLAAGSRVSESCSVCHQPAWCAACHSRFVGP